jgi:hypothetical protein
MSTTPVSFEKYLTDRFVTRETYDAMSLADQGTWLARYDLYVKPSGNLLSHPICIYIYRSYLMKLTPWLLLYIYFLTAPAREMKIMDAIKKRDHKKTAEIFINNYDGLIIGFIGGMTIAAVTRVYIPFRHRRWPYTAQQAQWMQQVLLIPLEKPFKTPPRIVLPFVFFGWCSDRGRRMFQEDL